MKPPAGPPLPGRHPDDIHEPDGVCLFHRVVVPDSVQDDQDKWRAGQILAGGLFGFFAARIGISDKDGRVLIAWRDAYCAAHGPHYANAPLPVWFENQRRQVWP